MHNAACVDCLPAWVDQISRQWRRRRIKKKKGSRSHQNLQQEGEEEGKDATCGTGNHTRTHPTDFQSCLTVSWCLLYTNSTQSAGTNSCDSQLLETGRKTQHSIDTQEQGTGKSIPKFVLLAATSSSVTRPRAGDHWVIPHAKKFPPIYNTHTQKRFACEMEPQTRQEVFGKVGVKGWLINSSCQLAERRGSEWR